VFTINMFTSQDKAGSRPPTTTRGLAPNRASFDTWTILTLPVPRGGRAKSALGTAAGLAGACLTAIPRRLSDRLFAMNDAEAYWRGWNIIKRHAGLTRRYHDPAFPVEATDGCDNHPPMTGWLPQPSDPDATGAGAGVGMGGADVAEGVRSVARDCREVTGGEPGVALDGRGLRESGARAGDWRGLGIADPTLRTAGAGLGTGGRGVPTAGAGPRSAPASLRTAGAELGMAGASLRGGRRVVSGGAEVGCGDKRA